MIYDKFQLSRPFASVGPPESVWRNSNVLLPGCRHKALGDQRGQHVLRVSSEKMIDILAAPSYLCPSRLMTSYYMPLPNLIA